MSNTNEAKVVLHKVCMAVVDTVNEAGPMGAPESALYLALSEQGCSLPVFNQIIDALTQARLIKKQGNVLLPV